MNSAWSARGSVLLGVFALVFLIGGFGIWSVMTRITGAVIAAGQVEVEQHRQVVQHPDGGVVAEILVSEGAQVEAGAPLIRLDGALLESELSIVESQLFEILARRGRLEAERDELEHIVFPDLLGPAAEESGPVRALLEGQVRLFEARKETHSQQVDQLLKRRGQILSQIDGLAAQREAAARRLAFTQEELVAQSSLLDRGLTQAPRVLALQREEAGLQGTLGEIAAGEAEAAARVTETDIEILRLGSQKREDALAQLRDLGYQELELAERRRLLLERLSLLDLRAPVAGAVYGLQVTTPRAVIRAAEPVLHIIPRDRPLIIATRVSPTEIDQVFVGQEARLVFPTFSSRLAPELNGLVSKLSGDAFTDDQGHGSYYRAEISLPAEEAAKLEGMTLLPGMPVEAYIQTGARSPLAYLVKPLSVYFNRAFRES